MESSQVVRAVMNFIGKPTPGNVRRRCIITMTIIEQIYIANDRSMSMIFSYGYTHVLLWFSFPKQKIQGMIQINTNNLSTKYGDVFFLEKERKKMFFFSTFYNDHIRLI